MSNSCSQNLGQEQKSDIIDDDNFEKDDLVSFQHDSKTINLFYSQLTKYSKLVRESYLFPDVINHLPQEIHKFQDEYHLLPDSVDYFFQLLQQNYNINEDAILTYIQCIDLLKISKFFGVRKLSSKINQYIKDHNVDVDFIIQMIQYDAKTQTETNNGQIQISSEIENILASKINKFFSNDKFDQLPIEIIYRIIEKSSPDLINSNKLFDIIIKSLSKFYVLFPFLDLQKLSEDRLEELCGMYSKSDEKTQHYFDYLKCNLNLINEINSRKKNLQEMNDQQQNKMKDLETKLQKQINDSEKVNAELKSQLDDSNNLINEQQSKMKDLETKFQNQINDSEKVNAELKGQLNDSNNLITEQQNKMKDLEEKIMSLQNQFNDSKNMNIEQQSKMKDLETLLQTQFNEQLQNQIKYSKELENQISELQNKLTISEKKVVETKKEVVPFEGQITASVEKEQFINADINLIIKHGTLDTTNSKVIVSTSDAKYLGSEAYEKGEPITSLHINTTFACKIGLYYVRCIVFNTEGESNEIVSNSVTTTAGSFTFGYEGNPAKISLPKGQYKLEVWGAKGGDSTGNGYSGHNRSNQQTVQGGLGGYSRGILNLKTIETIYVFVGEEGRPSNSSDNSSTKGGFPDGGGTKTGHWFNCTTVSGTGGGSTSIRIGSKSDFARVIVAGGGGGASGSSTFIDPGGFGGGLNGGHSSLEGSIQNQGGGTQSGSILEKDGTDDRKIDRGKFGLGGSGKYDSGCDSCGGGGGGWYGGCSGGGFGYTYLCSSGGGGSGWTFTEASMQAFKSGDSANSSQFALSSEYYLTDVTCVGGNEEFPRPDGNGNERGHVGNGYAKITPL
ncbi:hypothetical protein M9Y10_021175 [Tritrichomonas musculus]|uniref:receptor protein-tyrosine kinase n=1 Tax=Tritrichomonas musculus TaxID=1915356 RepID=A0ABR2HE31_9EUKA